MGGSSLHPGASPLGKITYTGPIPDTIIQLTETSGKPLAALYSLLSSLDMVHPPTPDSWPLIFYVWGENDQGYDSDGQIGLLFDAVYNERPLNVDNEEEFGIDDPEQAPYIPLPYAYITYDHIN